MRQTPSGPTFRDSGEFQQVDVRNFLLFTVLMTGATLSYSEEAFA